MQQERKRRVYERHGKIIRICRLWAIRINDTAAWTYRLGGQINKQKRTTMENLMLSIISKHPLNNNDMLYCPVTPIPPYFGSLRECRKAQGVFEKRLRKEFDTLSGEEKADINATLDYYRKRNGDYSA